MTHEFKYLEVESNHYLHRGSVDNHNSKLHDLKNSCGMSLEKTWITSRWEIESFCFVIVVCEINSFLVYILLTEA